MSNASRSYDFKSRLFSPVFLSWCPFLYYIDLMQKIGYGRNPYGFGFNKYYWGEVTLPLILSVTYLLLLFYFSPDIERKVNTAYRKLQPIVYSILMIASIFTNAMMFGSGNKTIMIKLGIVALIFIILMLKPMFSSEETVASNILK